MGLVYMELNKTTTDVINRVLELDEKATEGPWESDGSYIWDSETRMIADQHLLTGQIRARGNGDGLSFEQRESNLSMVANYRTTAPQLAKALKVAMEALSLIASLEVCDEECCAETRFAKEALEKINQIMEGKEA